jgi:arginine metabolism regulation protein II
MCLFGYACPTFFAQHIRRLGHRYLKPYVEDVLDRIEAVERIKTEWQVQALPLYWPAFIAASETFDLRLQDRF